MILDFDCCKRLNFDRGGVDQAVTAFLRNDPFYPQPGQALWSIFRQKYLNIATNILLQNPLFNDNMDIRDLPGVFIRRVQENVASQTHSTLYTVLHPQ